MCPWLGLGGVDKEAFSCPGNLSQGHNLTGCLRLHVDNQPDGKKEGALTCPFFRPTNRPSLPGGPPITLM